MEQNCESCDAKLNEIQQIEFPLNDLNEKCTNTVLKYLSPNDLVALSKTCKKQKQLAEKYFYLHCETEPIIITVEYLANRLPLESERFETRSKLMRFSVGAKHTKCNEKPKHGVMFDFKKSKEYAYEREFTSKIRSIHLILNPYKINSHVNPGHRYQIKNGFQFIQRNCAKDLVSLRLNGYYVDEISSFDSHIIRTQLAGLKRLEMNNIFVSKSVLSCCEQLEFLTFSLDLRDNSEHDKCNRHLNSDNSWLNCGYPNLNELSFSVPELIHVDLRPFLTQNANLKTIACSGFYAIKSLFQTTNHYRRVTLKFQCNSHYAATLGYIINRRFTCDELEIVMKMRKIKIDIFDVMNNLKNLVAAHWIMDSTMVDHLPRTNLSMPTLKKICMTSSDILLTDDIADSLDRMFPNLIELDLKVCLAPTDLEYTNQLFAIVNRFKNLEFLKIEHKFEIKFREIDMIKCNLIRSMLPNASKFVIALDSKNYFDYTLAEDASITVQPFSGLFCKHCSECDRTIQ